MIARVHEFGVDIVKIQYPLKQGLKQIECGRRKAKEMCGQNSISTKTRIETTFIRLDTIDEMQSKFNIH
ncbi:hypothetical protein CI957_1240 [Methanohalophilus sp. WG1-DM]|nr:hypothetical protein CI957_1240 [Methanohalophilus sp. WG1-DM]